MMNVSMIVGVAAMAAAIWGVIGIMALPPISLPDDVFWRRMATHRRIFHPISFMIIIAVVISILVP